LETKNFLRIVLFKNLKFWMVIVQFYMNRGDLYCYLTQSLLVDPVTAPCCKVSFSRDALKLHLGVTLACPKCGNDLTAFDVENAPTDISIEQLVKTFKDQIDTTLSTKVESDLQNWTASVIPLYDEKGKRLNMGQLKLALANAKFVAKPSLFIAVVDRSGSMAGNPWRQVETALLHIMGLTRSNPMVKTIIVAYDSSSEIINTSGTPDEVNNKIRSMFTGGGTNFRAAFDKVKEVLGKYTFTEEQCGENSVSNVTIAFLTDGQSGEKADALIKVFNDTLKDCWSKGPLSVHSIGFGGGCDKDLLEGLRKTGSVEGTFRFAEPSDDADTLCHKLTSLFDVASKSSVVSVNLNFGQGLFNFKNGDKFQNEMNIQFPVEQNRTGSYTHWVSVPDNIPNEDGEENIFGELIINSHIDENRVVPISIHTDANKRVFGKWLGQLTDELASELLELSQKRSTTQQNVQAEKNYYCSDNVFILHCSLMKQKIEAMRLASAGDQDMIDRLSFIDQQLNQLRSGAQINIGKLSDFRFGSQFASQTKAISSAKSGNQQLPSNNVNQAISNSSVWKERTPFYSRNNNNKSRNSLQESIASNEFNKISVETDRLLANSSLADIIAVDVDGNNALHLAAYCGQSFTVKRILDMYYSNGSICNGSICNIELLNNDGETAVTLAIKKRGFHKTLGHLLDCGAKVPENRKKGLERFAIDNGYGITAQILSNLSENNCSVDESMTPGYIMFSYNRLKNNAQLDSLDVHSYFRVCLSKTMVDMVKLLIEKHGAIPTFDYLLEYCIPKKPDHPDTPVYIELAKMFLNYNSEFVNMCDANEETPLFKAAERGSLPHVKLFIERGAEVDKSNNLGNSPLWIASAKKYPCIMTELLDCGADVNKTNFKGNPPIYSICQRGTKKFAELLLSRGANLEHINENGDTLILLCCRNGQHEILELFLNYVDPMFVDRKAHIDGFNAIFASVEADKPECIKVLKDYGVDCEQRTDEDNAILAGATPLHLAAYYGRTASAKVLVSECKVNVNCIDMNDQTPLHIAVIQGNIDMITLFRNFKADLTIKDKSGNTAVSYSRNRQEIRDVLINPGLDILMKLSKGFFNKDEEKEAIDVIQKYCGVVGCLDPSDSLDVISEDGSTPLLQSVIHGIYPLAKLFLDMGCNANIKNTHGIDSIVWGRWVKNPRINNLVYYNTGLNSADSNEYEESCLKRLKECSQNPLNAQLLFLPSKPSSPKTLVSTIGTRMEGIVYSFQTKQPFQIPVSENEMSDIETQLMWNAKVFTTNLIASGKTFLSPIQVMSICTFTNNPLYALQFNNAIVQNQNDVNTYITDGSQTDNSMKVMKLPTTTKERVWTLYKTLECLDSYVGEAFFGVNNLDRHQFTVGSEIMFPGFLSCSTLWRVATEHVADFATKKKQGNIFIVKSKTGKYVGQYSEFSYDSEVLFKPFTKFVVTNLYHGDVICLGQANIREHTFRIKDEKKRWGESEQQVANMHETLDMMLNSNKSMIIELTETAF
jgi:ankyrin repeat protein